MEAYGPAVMRLAYNQLRSLQQAEDVYQETFSELFARIGKVEFDTDYHLRAWLMKVAVNKCKNAKRNAARHKEDLMDPLDSASFGSRTTQEDGHLDYVWEIVDQLSSDFRLVVYLHYVDGYSTDEIAAITNVTSATVRTRLFRARAKIKLLLEKGVV